MACHLLREAIVDHARGVAQGPGTAAAVECHLGVCGECRALVAREQRMTLGLRALARSMAQDQAPRELEARLLDAFAARHPMNSDSARPVEGRWRSWLSAAAAVVILAGVATWVLFERRNAPTDAINTEVDRQIVPSAGRTEASGARPVSSTPNQETTARKSARAARPANKGTITDRPRTEAAAPDMDDFIAIPAALGLPALESGQIVRVDLPVASLPAFGVEIISDARRTDVQADVLVGQDGQPRAIRLVSSDQTSRSRQ